MNIKLWKNFPKKGGMRISANVTPQGLVELWNSKSNMENLKTDASTVQNELRAQRCLRLSLEAGSTPFVLLERKGFQVIEATVSI